MVYGRVFSPLLCDLSQFGSLAASWPWLSDWETKWAAAWTSQPIEFKMWKAQLRPQKMLMASPDRPSPLPPCLWLCVFKFLKGAFFGEPCPAGPSLLTFPHSQIPNVVPPFSLLPSFFAYWATFKAAPWPANKSTGVSSIAESVWVKFEDTIVCSQSTTTSCLEENMKVIFSLVDHF